MSALRIQNLQKSFGDQVVLSGVNLRVDPGGFTFLLGPSGCGKTTLLRLVAGLDRPDHGIIELFGRMVNDPRPLVPPPRREIGMVFQHDALWPHMTVAGHLRYVLRGRVKPGQTHERIARLLEMVHLSGMESRLPASLSGGERQRLSLARALAPRPRLMLMDEPTRNLDRPLARSLRAEFSAVLRQEGVTVLYVTHDQEEAFTLADRIVLLDAGRILAEGTPEELYVAPPDARSAALLGLTTAVHGVVGPNGGIGTPLGTFPSELAAGREFAAFFRPEDLRLCGAGDGIPALVRGGRFLGTHRELDVDVDGLWLGLRISTEDDPRAGSTVHVRAARPPTVFPKEAP